MNSKTSRRNTLSRAPRGRARRFLATGALVSMIGIYGCMKDEVAGSGVADTEGLQEANRAKAKDTTSGKGGPGSGTGGGLVDTVHSGGPDSGSGGTGGSGGSSGFPGGR